MKYIIMCGGTYKEWETPRQLTEIAGEPIVARTIRLLRDAGVDDIAISSDNTVFEQFGIPVLQHQNDFVVINHHSSSGYWSSAFYPTDESTCYIFGDVVFSPEAIKTIVDYETDDIMFFGSKRPFAPQYPKPHEEPFAFKIVNTEHFREAIKEHKRLADAGTHWRHPIAWELWFIICGKDPAQDLKNLINDNYVGIYDYSCDIDSHSDIDKFRGIKL